RRWRWQPLQLLGEECGGRHGDAAGLLVGGAGGAIRTVLLVAGVGGLSFIRHRRVEPVVVS
ncbi:MAG: hypothetical protein ACK559_00660, partial [bacterium]